MKTHKRQRPVISLVTPNYNGAAFLRETLESVLSQHYPALEYVFVDGASTDGSRLIAEQYRDNLSAVISEPDKGHADALNKGFALTSGEIMGWINSDDSLHPGCLLQVERVFELHPKVEWITGRPSAMNVRSEIDYVGAVRPWSRLRFLAGDHLWIQQESTFWRRSLWERAGGYLDTHFDLANDFELWARFFRHADLYTVDRMLGCFRLRPGQRSVDSHALYKREVHEILQRELDMLDPKFRKTSGGLIASSPRELIEDEREALDPLLRVLDPPIIRMGAVRRNNFIAQAAGGAQLGQGLRTPEPASDLSALKDKHRGQRCIILGNGPSLNQTDLSLLDGETVFACNAIHLLFDRIDWRPAYYTCVDSQVLPDRAADIEAMLAASPAMTAFFPAEIQIHGGDRRRMKGRDVIADGPNRYFFNEEPGELDALPESMFSLDAESRVVQPHTVAITMMQLAAHMGFCELVLVGCDMSYTVPATVQRESDGGADDPRLTSIEDDDPNHFDPRYFGAGRKWHRPNTALMREHYRVALQALDLIGVTVRNATVGGALEVFERESLADVVSRPPTPLQAREAGALTSTVSDTTEPATGARRFVERWTPTLMHNLGFIAGALVALAALGAAALVLAEWRIWVVMTGLFGAALAFSAAVALKSRRILINVHETLNDTLGDKAEAQIALQQIELEIEALHAELLELRRARASEAPLDDEMP